MLADELDYVVGVDTHRDRHALAVVAAPSGGVVAQRSVLEGGRGPRNERRLRGKDDPLDAVRAARATLASERLALPRSGSGVELCGCC